MSAGTISLHDPDNNVNDCISSNIFCNAIPLNFNLIILRVLIATNSLVSVVANETFP